MDETPGVTMASIGYPKGSLETPYDMRGKLFGPVKYNQITGANFTGDWVLGTVELDEDNLAYVLIPRGYLEEEE